MLRLPACICGAAVRPLLHQSAKPISRTLLRSNAFASTSLPRAPLRFASTRTTAPSSRPTISPQQAMQEAIAKRRAQLHAERNRSLLLYSAATIILVTAASYLAVPLYRVFCSATGYAGTPLTDKSRFSSDRLMAAEEGETRRIRVKFNADRSDSLPWSFEPIQKEVQVLPGETALAFYTATNNSDEDIIGIATYNVTPNNVRLLAFNAILFLSLTHLYTSSIDCSLFRKSRMLLLRGATYPSRRRSRSPSLLLYRQRFHGRSPHEGCSRGDTIVYFLVSLTPSSYCLLPLTLTIALSCVTAELDVILMVTWYLPKPIL